MRFLSSRAIERDGDDTAGFYLPEELADRAPRSRVTRLGWRIALLCLAVCLLESGVRRGGSVQRCELCGASSFVSEFRLFGMGGEYDRVTQTGPVSMFIESKIGQPCQHQWRTFRGGVQSPLGCYCGDGHPIKSAAYLEDLEQDPLIAEFLQRKAAENPAFLQSLQDAIASSDDGARQFFFELFEELAQVPEAT